MSTDEGESKDESSSPSVQESRAGDGAKPTPEETKMTVTDVDTTRAPHAPIAPGTAVEVRSSFDQRWTSGFEVVEASDTDYRLRRLSDGTDLPGRFSRDDIRRERRRGGQWWY